LNVTTTPRRWRRLGQIFECAKHSFKFADGGFAQSPQALVLDDRVRVYFSTRQRDAGGKFLSLPVYADFSRDFSKLIGVAEKPVMELGELGTFDEHGIFPLSPFRSGTRLMALTTGWTRRQSVSTDGGIGLVESFDGGASFQRVGRGPVMGSSLHEPFLVSDGFALRDGAQHHMWYIHGVRWIQPDANEPPDRVYKIAHASSVDLLKWRRTGRQILPDALGPDECQALPTVLRCGTEWHMVFCYRHATGFRTDASRGYRLGHAVSDDGVSWTRRDDDWTLLCDPADWDGSMQCYPNLFEVDGRIYLLYNGNAFGREGFGLAVLENT
jgi:hypothetical protein